MLLRESDGGSVVVPEYATQEMQRRLATVARDKAGHDKVVVLVQKLRQAAATSIPPEGAGSLQTEQVRPRAMAS